MISRKPENFCFWVDLATFNFVYWVCNFNFVNQTKTNVRTKNRSVSLNAFCSDKNCFDKNGHLLKSHFSFFFFFSARVLNISEEKLNWWISRLWTEQNVKQKIPLYLLMSFITSCKKKTFTWKNIKIHIIRAKKKKKVFFFKFFMFGAEWTSHI